MLSGFLLLSKDYPLGDFLKRRFTRVVVPALFWMVVYSIYNHIAKGSPANIGQAALNIVNGSVHYHLWFIYLIIGLYLIYPVLRPWVRTASEQEFLYFFALCAFCTWFYKLLWTFTGTSIGIYFELFTNNCGYFVLGYYLGAKFKDPPSNQPASLNKDDSQPPTTNNQQPATTNNLTWIAIGLIVLGTLATMLASYFLNRGHGDAPIQVIFYDYLTPNVGIAAIGWFLFAMQTFNSRHLLRVEREFSAASFGIYFAHVLVMDWWGQCGYWHSKVHSFVWLTSLIGLITCMAFLGTMFIRALPGGKKVT